MSDIIITEFMDETAITQLRAAYQVLSQDDLWSRRQDLKAQLRQTRALIVRNRTQVDAEILAAAPNLKIVARLGVGLDNIDLEICARRGIEVCPARGANSAPVAEYVLACAMILMRGAALRGTAQLRQGQWPRLEFAQGREIGGKVLGIVGYGSIGRLTAQRGAAMGMTVIAYDPAPGVSAQDSPTPNNAAPPQPALPQASPLKATMVTLNELVATADVISLHCPLTSQTRHLIDEAMFARMKPGAILINAARGGIVDEAACAAALRRGQLGGAALDVFQTEPLDAPAAAMFDGIDNIILTPHIAGVTVEANIRASAICADHVLRALKAHGN